MFIRKKLSVGALVLSAVLLFSSCNLFDKGPEKSPEEVVKEALSKAYDVKSGDYQIDFDVKLANESGPESAPFKTVAFDGKISGVYDVRNLASPIMSMVMEIKGKRDEAEKEEKFKIELRVLGEKAYVVLNEITDFEGNLPMVLVEPFKGQWYSIPIPKDVLETAMAGYKDEASMTEEEKKMKELWQDMMFFADLKYDGSEKIYGVDTYKYSGKVDREILKDYVTEAYKLNGQEMPAADLEEMSKFFDKAEMSAELWISKDDTMIRKMAMDMKMKDIEGVDVAMTVGYNLPTLGGDVELEVPADAQEFDPSSFLEGMMGIPAPGTETVPLELPEVETGEPIILDEEDLLPKAE